MSFVQDISNSASVASGTTIAVTLTGVTAGNMIRVVVAYIESGAQRTITVNDGNSYTATNTQYYDASNDQFGIQEFSLSAATAGSHVITATFSGATSSQFIYAQERANCYGTRAVGSIATNTVPGTSGANAIASNAITTSAVADVCGFCVMFATAPAITTGTTLAWTGRTANRWATQASAGLMASEDLTAQTANNFTATFGMSAAGNRYYTMVNAYYQPSTAPMNVVQFTDSGPNASATTAAISFVSTPTPGDAVLVQINLKGSVTVSSVTDNQTNTYVKVTTEDSAVGAAELWWCPSVVASGTFTVTVTPSATASYVVSLLEVAGLLSIDQTNAIEGTPGGASPVSITNGTVNSGTNDFVVTACQYGIGYSTGPCTFETPPGNNGVSGAFTTWSFYDTGSAGANPAGFGISSGYKIVTATETSTAIWTFGTVSGSREQIVLATFTGNAPVVSGAILLGAICL